MNTIDAKRFYNEVMPDKQGADYEQARWHHNAVATVGYEQTKKSILKVLPKDASIASVLEIGPGAGTWSKFLLTTFPNASFTLLDISREMLTRAQAVLGEEHITYIESAFGDYQSKERFDYVFSSRMLEYVEDKDLFAKKIAQIISVGGKGCLITKYPHYGRLRLQGKQVRNFHTGQISPSDLKHALSLNGLSVTSTKAVTVSVPLFKSATLNKLAGVIIQALPLNFMTAVFVESYLVTFKRNHDN